jgi:hypothetical protein
MGFLWEGSTGARAVQLLRTKEPGTIMQTPELAQALGAKQTLLHQLLSNAVNLRLLKKVRVPGSAFTGWKLGAGNDSANIEPRPPRPEPGSAEAVRRAAAARRRCEREALRDEQGDGSVGKPQALAWPPGFVAKFFDPPWQPDSERAPRSAMHPWTNDPGSPR